MSLNRFLPPHHNHHHHHGHRLNSHQNHHHDHHHHHHLYQQGQGTIQVGEPSNKTVVNIPIADGGSFGELALIYGEDDDAS